MWWLVFISVAAATSPDMSDKCGANAYYETCIPECPKHQNCSLIWSKIPCVETPGYCCQPGCYCKSGFFRDDNYKCVSGKQCMGQPDEEPTTTAPEPEPHNCGPKPQKCKGPNEKWVQCRTICPPQKCDISYTEYSCPIVKKCEPGCDCIKDHLRLANGTCVKNNNCPPPPKPKPDPKPPKCKGPNEIFKKCRTICPPQKCDISYTSYICTQDIKCEPGCDCIKDHLRLNGTCVKNDDCPPPPTSTEPPTTEPKCGYNEKLNPCFVSCPPQDCEAQYLNYLCAAKDENFKCEPGCSCLDGYLRNASRICVPTDQCPPPPWVIINPEPTSSPEPPVKTCGMNETYVFCSARCPPYDTCPVSDSRGIIACDPPNPCPPGCVCKVGYRRRSSTEDTCILAEECPKIKCNTRPNEVFKSCPDDCRVEYCSNKDNQPTTCNTLIKNCQPKCVCKDGYYRDDTTDLCVPEKECKPKQPTCGKNETYVQCRSDCNSRYCPENDLQDSNTFCSVPAGRCPSGCACKLGYRWKSRKDKTCIRAEECPRIKCNGKNEIFSSCPSSCLAESCDDVNNQPTVCNDLVHNCNPRCICKKGFFRKNGTCVAAKECPKPKCPKNENYAQCVIPCPTNYCPTDGTGLMPQCQMPMPCLPGCVCNGFNYLRKSRKNPICIPAKECPAQKCPGSNQEWNNCPSTCLKEKCSDIGKEIPCVELQPRYCKPRCTCKKGFYKNESSNDCVPASECGGDGCGVNKTTVYCPSFRCPNQICPENDDPFEIACKPPRDCPSGCGCKDGYLYLDSGSTKCVKAKDCPPVQCTRENEEWNPCTKSCNSEKCEDINKPIDGCTDTEDYCKPKCACKKGFCRNSNMECEAIGSQKSG